MKASGSASTLQHFNTTVNACLMWCYGSMDVNNNMVEEESWAEITVGTESKDAEKRESESIVGLWCGFTKSDTDQIKVISITWHQKVVISDLKMSTLFYHLKT